jgi:hypothetical protein
MWKWLQEYKDFVLWVNRVKTAVDRHHVLPIVVYWPDIAENLENLIQSDHVALHKQLDISGRYLTTLTREQRKRENGHIVLTESDIEWRADMQRMYLEGIEKLPHFLQELHDTKLWELAQYEAGKFKRLTGTEYPVELWEAMQNHWTYIDIMKEASKYIYKKLRW